MRKLTRGLPSPAMVVALAALFVGLGGTAYAAFTLPKNSVGNRQLKNGAVTTKKLKNGAVTASKLNVSGVTVPNALHSSTADRATNALHATTADTATNATELGNLPPTAFAHGQSFSGHAALTSSSETEIVNVPGLGQLTGDLGPGGVILSLTGGTNQTGQSVDQSASDFVNSITSETAASVAAGGTWVWGVGSSVQYGTGTPRIFIVQLAWGSGSASHVVTMTVSVFASGSAGDVIVQGTAS